MKKIAIPILLAVLTAMPSFVSAQDDAEVNFKKVLDSLLHSFQWKTGQVSLGDNLAEINVPGGWRYLPVEQSSFVLEQLWGNPPSATLGMLFPENVSPLDSNAWAFDISFEDIGYVKDTDADEFDYKEILENMQKEAETASAERQKQGYDPVKIIGWASEPFYDKQKKVLHWAKEIQFGEDGSVPRTLNYDIRALGRKGVLSMNAIGGMDRLPEVKNQIPAITNSISFTAGNRYADFDSKIDNVAAWTIGGLVAGKVLAKAGFFALILKFLKPILLVLFAAGAYIWRFVTGRKKEEETPDSTAETAPTPSDENPSSDEKPGV